jgi:hypothetical protein
MPFGCMSDSKSGSEINIKAGSTPEKLRIHDTGRYVHINPSGSYDLGKREPLMTVVSIITMMSLMALLIFYIFRYS